MLFSLLPSSLRARRSLFGASLQGPPLQQFVVRRCNRLDGHEEIIPPYSVTLTLKHSAMKSSNKPRSKSFPDLKTDLSDTSLFTIERRRHRSQYLALYTLESNKQPTNQIHCQGLHINPDSPDIHSQSNRTLSDSPDINSDSQSDVLEGLHSTFFKNTTSSGTDLNTSSNAICSSSSSFVKEDVSNTEVDVEPSHMSESGQMQEKTDRLMEKEIIDIPIQEETANLLMQVMHNETLPMQMISQSTMVSPSDYASLTLDEWRCLQFAALKRVNSVLKIYELPMIELSLLSRLLTNTAPSNRKKWWTRLFKGKTKRFRDNLGKLVY